MFPQILDPCCGPKMMYFDKVDPRVLFGDKRRESHILCDGRVIEISPDLLCNFQALPFPDSSFSLVVFDPPHIDHAGPLSWQAKKYGKLDKYTYPQELRHGFMECWRCLKPAGTLIFKWSEVHITLSRVLDCFPEKPVFGHTTNSKSSTHWMCFFKEEER